FFSGRRRHTSSYGDWSPDVCSSDLAALGARHEGAGGEAQQQVAGPAEQPVEGERRMGLRMQEIEPGPQGEIHREKGGDLVEADRSEERSVGQGRRGCRMGEDVLCTQ